MSHFLLLPYFSIVFDTKTETKFEVSVVNTKQSLESSDIITLDCKMQFNVHLQAPRHSGK